MAGERFPNLLIVGAAKAGTSSFYEYIRQHPEIFMSEDKEPEFFAWDGRRKEMNGPGGQAVLDRAVTDIDAYRNLFSEATDEKILGEASTSYLYIPTAPERIRHHIPDTKLIAILRNPIDRAYSNFLHAQRERREPLGDFAEALAAEPNRIRDLWGRTTHYTQMGMYAQQLERYEALFPVEQMRIYLHDDLARDPLGVVEDALRFLAVDPTFVPDVERNYNRGVKVRSARGHLLLHSERVRSVGKRVLPARLRRSLYSNLSQLNRAADNSITPATREHLARVFRTEVHKLSWMVGRDLTPWLQCGTVKSPEPGTPIGMTLAARERWEDAARRHLEYGTPRSADATPLTSVGAAPQVRNR